MHLNCSRSRCCRPNATITCNAGWSALKSTYASGKLANRNEWQRKGKKPLQTHRTLDELRLELQFGPGESLVGYENALRMTWLARSGTHLRREAVRVD
eukprot:SAG11_NODE_2552_length_3229_cov_1.244728_5_plen_98_part_00